VIAVDASAVLAILLQEDEAGRFAQRLAEAGGGAISPVNYWEALIKANRVHGTAGAALVDEVLAELNVTVSEIDATNARSAAVAFERFRGRPGGRLNLGDSFAYALAAREGDGLLYKGNDFPKTDVKNALYD
jgi:ribonuclease VapC